MAPDMDPSKPFSAQDPKATLKSPPYAQFKGRFTALATSLAMPAGAGAAQDIWMKVVAALQKTDADYQAAPTDGKTARKDLSSDAFQKIMQDFEPITAALAPYMEKYAHGKKSWAFWSGKPAVEVARKHAEVCLEKSALGSLFDGININGSWDIQMWAQLSKAYATHAAAHVGQATYRGFVGLGSSADQSIFNKIEQPQFVGMLDETARATLHVDWYAAAGDPKAEMRQPDWRFHAGAFDGVYGTGDRAAMVALAESENKRRLDLFKDKGIDEGPGAAPGDKTDETTTEPIDGITTAFDAKGEGHTLSVVDKDGGGKVLMASGNPEELNRKAANVRKTLKAYEDEPSIPDDFKLEIMQMAEDLEAELARIKEATEQVLFAGATNAKKRKPDDVTKRRRERSITALDQAAAQIKALATKHGLADFSPHGVEIAKQKAWEARVLKPVQAQVDAILAKYKARILAALPGASVKYRGSLASGWKGPHKLSADGSALRFDPTSFDCDAFIEVPGTTWAEWAAQDLVPSSAPFLVKLDAFNGPGAARLEYNNYVSGLTISCLDNESWTEGNVYRLVGGNDVCCRFDTLEEMDMSFHVLHLLSRSGLARIMSFNEFRDESRRRRAAPR